MEPRGVQHIPDGSSCRASHSIRLEKEHDMASGGKTNAGMKANGRGIEKLKANGKSFPSSAKKGGK